MHETVCEKGEPHCEIGKQELREGRVAQKTFKEGNAW
jgi:hypothetical protein